MPTPFGGTAGTDCAVRVYDVLARNAHLTGLNARPSPPVTVQGISARVLAARTTPGAAVFCVTYAMNLRDRHTALAARVELTLNALCAVTAHCTPQDLERFAMRGLLRQLHPHLAENVHRLTVRAGLPPPVLKVYRPTRTFDLT